MIVFVTIDLTQDEYMKPFKGIAKDHSKSLVRSSTCLVILDYFHFTPLV